MANEIPFVTESDFKEKVLAAAGPVVILFWTSWCASARLMNEIMEQLAEERPEIKFFRIDADRASSICIRYGIRGLPTVSCFLDGVKKDEIIGLVPKQAITIILDLINGK